MFNFNNMIINLTDSEEKFIELQKTGEIDSMEEVYFIWWLQELYRNGYIVSTVYYQGNSFELSPSVTIKKVKQLVTKTKTIERQLLKPHIYTPDFRIQWFSKSLFIFVKPFFTGKDVDINVPFIFEDVNDLISTGTLIEIKGGFSRHGRKSEIIFSINQKWLYSSRGIYVNMVKIPEFFSKTFTPLRYFSTDLTKKPKKISDDFKIRTLEEYVATFKR